MTQAVLTARDWLSRIDAQEEVFLRGLYDVFENPGARLPLMRSVVARFLDRFGDRPLRLFRAPGRINLRGMHVDTHGGYLNLMTHQREVMVAAAPSDDDVLTFANTDPCFTEIALPLGSWRTALSSASSWTGFIASPLVRGYVGERRGDWGNYILGSVLSAQFRNPYVTVGGMMGVIGSDVPRGASLSSSAALCTAVVSAASACYGGELDADGLMRGARDAEWFTGSRCGLSDQAAIVLPEARGELVNIALRGMHLKDCPTRRMVFPDAVRVLVINSYTERSLSGAAHVAYTRNRFAYSLALAIARHELAELGEGHDASDGEISLAVLGDWPSPRTLYRLLGQIPEELDIDALRARYKLPELDAAYNQYFGGIPEAERPASFNLRGPLLFGIAESARARRFFDALAGGQYADVGRLMTLGHDGDRRFARGGGAFSTEQSSRELDAWEAAETPIETLPGAYGAGSAVLDALVDAAMDAGALGASLTGAGIAGSVVALCRTEEAGAVAQRLRDWMGSAAYAQAAGRSDVLSPALADATVVINQPSARAGELLGV